MIKEALEEAHPFPSKKDVDLDGNGDDVDLSKVRALQSPFVLLLLPLHRKGNPGTATFQLVDGEDDEENYKDYDVLDKMMDDKTLWDTQYLAVQTKKAKVD